VQIAAVLSRRASALFAAVLDKASMAMRLCAASHRFLE
jgi:hypothetical protein